MSAQVTWKSLWLYSPGDLNVLPQREREDLKDTEEAFNWDAVISRGAGCSLLLEVQPLLLTVLSLTRWWGQLKRKVPNKEMRALSYRMVRYTSENSKAAGYCSSSCQTQSRNIKNKGDWEKKQEMIRFNISFSKSYQFLCSYGIWLYHWYITQP